MKKTIALIYGGEGCEREVSKASAENLYSMIDKTLYEVMLVFIADDGCWFIKQALNEQGGIPTYPVRINSRSGFFQNGKVLAVSLAVIALHGDCGEDGIIQGALDSAHIKYIGCDVFSSSVCCDKIYTKIIAEHLGIPTADWIFSTENEDTDMLVRRCEQSIGYPLFVKPARLGSSIGISRAKNRKELTNALLKARKYSSRLLIEQAIDAECEIECGFFDSDGTEHISPSGKILTSGIFYDYDQKYNGVSSPKISHGIELDADIRLRLIDYSKRLAKLIALRHLSRIDYFISSKGEIIFNEINTFPGMTKTSLYPHITEDMGFSAGEFINLLLSEGCK